MPLFDNNNYALRLAASGESTNALTGLVPPASIVDLVFTFDDLNIGEATLTADNALLGGRGVYWAYEFNDEFRISGTTLDFFEGSANNDVIDMTGSDGGYAPEVLGIEGGEGDDVLWAGGGDADVFGDFIEATEAFIAGNDQIVGGNGVDFLFGDVADSEVAFTGGNDEIFALSGNDEIYGDAFGVEVEGTLFGSDFLAGGAGFDRIIGDTNFLVADSGEFLGGNDTIRGDAGKDTIIGDFGIVAPLDSMTVTGGNDIIHGGNQNDRITGDFFRLVGDVDFTGGNDTINGGAGNDLLIGDVFDNLTFDDTLEVFGNDTFVFDGAFGRDTITDFGFGDDILDVSGLGVTLADLDDSGGGLFGDEPDGIIDAQDTRVSDAGSNLRITPTGSLSDGRIILEDITALDPSQFVFA